MSFRPNPPRMITVVIAIVLLVIGVGAALLPAATVRDLVLALPIGRDLDRQLLGYIQDQTIAYLLALVAPLLLVVGSLAPGI